MAGICCGVSWSRGFYRFDGEESEKSDESVCTCLYLNTVGSGAGMKQSILYLGKLFKVHQYVFILIESTVSRALSRGAASFSLCIALDYTVLYCKFYM